MVGLSASELQAETLFPGDTVEYFSMAFVAGDPRGHRVSKVLRVDRNNLEFPIHVDTQEILPLTIMLKRKRDRNDAALSSDEAKWRKLRTFMLVDGEVEGETRAERLNAGLRKSLLDARRSTKAQLARERVEGGGKSNGFTSALATETSSQSRLVKARAIVERKQGTLLTVRGNRKRVKAREKAGLQRGRKEDKVLQERRLEEDTVRIEALFKDDKHKSHKRKRKEVITEQLRHQKAGPARIQERISKYFEVELKRQTDKHASLDLTSFLLCTQEKDERTEIKKEEKKRTCWALDDAIALNERERGLERDAPANPRASNKSLSRPGISNKNEWSEQRTIKHKATDKSIRSWLNPLVERKDKLFTPRQGVAVQPQLLKQQLNHTATDKQQLFGKIRKNGNFLKSANGNTRFCRGQELNYRVSGSVLRQYDQFQRK